MRWRSKPDEQRPTFDEVGTRVAEILRMAEEQAEAHLADARREAEEIIAAARREAEEIRAAARREADEIVAAARREVRRINDGSPA
jgi:F0F1-type ATP synthase membrane subunit b/b'